jgi:hypothetical protein
VRTYPAATALLLMLGAAGCTATPQPQALPRPVPAPSATGPAPADADGVGAAPSSTPEAAAVDAAETYVRLWARPELAEAAWYTALRELTTPGYAVLLADTDPANVPAHTVTGPARVMSSTTAVLVADVVTDTGPIRVTVTHHGNRWLIATAGPAPSPGGGS